jgi:hypothetical protein
MTKKTFIGLLFCLTFQLSVIGQVKKDSVKKILPEYATLRLESRLLIKNLYVILNDTQWVDLIEKLNLKWTTQKNWPDYKLTDAGFNFLDKQGYEFLSASSYGEINNFVKEYIFRRKKTSDH